jgi:hypothetical protein
LLQTEHAFWVESKNDPLGQLPEGDIQSGAQASQVAFLPEPTVENDPEGHAPPVGGGHWPLSLLLAQPSKQYRPAGHGLQLGVTPDPRVEKLPAGQFPLPLAEVHPSRQYFPAGQGKQLPVKPAPTTE